MLRPDRSLSIHFCIHIYSYAVSAFLYTPSGKTSCRVSRREYIRRHLCACGSSNKRHRTNVIEQTPNINQNDHRPVQNPCWNCCRPWTFDKIPNSRRKTRVQGLSETLGRRNTACKFLNIFNATEQANTDAFNYSMLRKFDSFPSEAALTPSSTSVTASHTNAVGRTICTTFKVLELRLADAHLLHLSLAPRKGVKKLTFPSPSFVYIDPFCI